MGLGDVVASASGSGDLKKVIQLRLKRDEKVPFLEENGYIRISSFADMCPREEVLCSLEKHIRSRKIETDLNLIFAHGSALHWALQNKILPDADVLVGVWRCIGCAKDYGSATREVPIAQTAVRRPAKCDGCGSEEFLYREQQFISREYMIGGHPDGFLVVPGMPGVGIVECKSISSRGAWEVRNVPNISHAIQAQLYMWLTDIKWAKILYWDKGAFGMGCLIEHTIERDDETIEQAQKTIRSIRNGIASGLLPDRVCENASCPRASKCEVRGPCFAKVA